MAKFSISASCVAKDESKPSYEAEFEIKGAANIMKRFGLTQEQFEQEAADNLARRITNGCRQIMREKGKETDYAELDKYVAEWQPGRKQSASPINAVKKMLKEKELTPEQSEMIEAILAKAAKEAAKIAGEATVEE